MANFFAMGGYAVFVWPAYVVTVLVLVTAIVLSLQAHARARKAVRQLEAEQDESGAAKE
jgi:heme exporter protein CcmD